MIIVLNSNPIHKFLEDYMIAKYNAIIVNRKDDFSIEFLKSVNPKFIFIPHWSYLIPAEIYDNYNCIVFHMTDLPYGRGGSPLQNLIVRGHTETKISALKVEEELDAGDIYLKRPLSLHGTAEEIFLRFGKVVIKMIETIVEENPIPVPQNGRSLNFKRRNKDDGNLEELQDLEILFDYIRMLDAKRYPKSFLETKYFRFEFSRASLKCNEILADVRIIKK